MGTRLPGAVLPVERDDTSPAMVWIVLWTERYAGGLVTGVCTCSRNFDRLWASCLRVWKLARRNWFHHHRDSSTRDLQRSLSALRFGALSSFVGRWVFRLARKLAFLMSIAGPIALGDSDRLLDVPPGGRFRPNLLVFLPWRVSHMQGKPSRGLLGIRLITCLLPGISDDRRNTRSDSESGLDPLNSGGRISRWILSCDGKYLLDRFDLSRTGPNAFAGKEIGHSRYSSGENRRGGGIERL